MSVSAGDSFGVLPCAINNVVAILDAEHHLERYRKLRIAAAISSQCVSRATRPVSKNRTSASGMSRLNASAPAGRKSGSFLPHTCQKRRLVLAKMGLEFGIQRDAALVVAE